MVSRRGLRATDAAHPTAGSGAAASRRPVRTRGTTGARRRRTRGLLRVETISAIADLVLRNEHRTVGLIGEHNHHATRHTTKRQLLVHIRDDLALHGLPTMVRDIVGLVARQAVDADRM